MEFGIIALSGRPNQHGRAECPAVHGNRPSLQPDRRSPGRKAESIAGAAKYYERGRSYGRSQRPCRSHQPDGANVVC